MSTRVYESAIIAKPISDVWAAIRSTDFAFSTAVSNTELDGKADWDDVGGVRKVTYTDRTVQKFKLLELSDANRQLTFELLESSPAVTYLAAVTSWKLKRISHDNTTLFESVTDFSKDASPAVTSDSKYKKLDQFNDLRKYISGGVAKRTFDSVGREAKVPIGGIVGTKNERSFIAVKPDGVQRALVGEIISRFERRGYKLVALKLTWPTKEKAEGHYDDLKARPFFPALVKFFSSGPIVAMVWEGLGVIAGGRKLLGETDPKASAPGTIRGDYAVDVGRNICHGSDGPSGAAREIAFWFSPDEVANYCATIAPWVYEK
jgi:nucleoside-diphosphate kinase